MYKECGFFAIVPSMAVMDAQGDGVQQKDSPGAPTKPVSYARPSYLPIYRSPRK